MRRVFRSRRPPRTTPAAPGCPDFSSPAGSPRRGPRKGGLLRARGLLRAPSPLPSLVAARISFSRCCRRRAAAAAAAAALLRRHLLLLGVALARAALAALAAIARHDNHLDVFALGAALRGRVLGHRLGPGPVARCCRLGALGAGLGHRLGALGPLGRLGSTARAALPLAVVVVVVLFLVVVVLLLVALLLVALLLLALAEHHARKRAALLPLPRLALRARALRGGPAEPLVVEGELLVVLELAAAVGALDLQLGLRDAEVVLDRVVRREHHVVAGEDVWQRLALRAVVRADRQRAGGGPALDLGLPLLERDDRHDDEGAAPHQLLAHGRLRHVFRRRRRRGDGGGAHRRLALALARRRVRGGRRAGHPISGPPLEEERDGLQGLAHPHLVCEDASADRALLLRAQPAEPLLLVRQHLRGERRGRLALRRPERRGRLNLFVDLDLAEGGDWARRRQHLAHARRVRLGEELVEAGQLALVGERRLAEGGREARAVEVLPASDDAPAALLDLEADAERAVRDELAAHAALCAPRLRVLDRVVARVVLGRLAPPLWPRRRLVGRPGGGAAPAAFATLARLEARRDGPLQRLVLLRTCRALGRRRPLGSAALLLWRLVALRAGPL
mmetsp:Transcript_10022/g.29675  ORF Transcript_10022/g.29675 Transcript_10022/m.29675 type:complete len:621 (+) Transcript_10022:1042-2904(+)